MKRICLMLCLTFALPTLAQGDAEAGKTKSQTCAACHGPDGNSAVDMYPKLAGQHYDYLLKQLREFKLGAQTNGDEGRYDPVMSSQAMPLSEQDMHDLAAFYASQEPMQGSTPEDVIAQGEALYRGGDTERKVTACIACHGPRGDGMGLANFPDISGQHSTYLKAQLEKFRSGDRNNDHNGMMRDIAMKLTDEDIEILSKYISGLY
ncbi:Cytochrome c4 [Saliniradius amylolyticus]|uniref:Cytochrome c4 n=1 Tax=Saliniradius amylolyticus TaxID=2183582 RepID=A0A2S2DYT2_9ALTE|nr:c-type cytochrome [Saliniradius amylolyticus]AWL10526.1 Cytochrome c4 [Saliniradius amylolyticus]